MSGDADAAVAAFVAAEVAYQAARSALDDAARARRDAACRVAEVTGMGGRRLGPYLRDALTDAGHPADQAGLSDGNVRRLVDGCHRR